ncbi:unnamed protein product [Pylaiella littoralis]
MASEGSDSACTAPSDMTQQDLLRPSLSEMAPPEASQVLGEDEEAAAAAWDEEGGLQSDKEFRRRRLTFATQPRMSSNVSPPEVSAFSIYRALELGEEDAKQMAPFPASVLGIHSCHGAEPGWGSGEEDLAKINQDRACVVHPFMGSETCALLCVYDGHGEHGDVVSNYVMNELPKLLASHPKLVENPGVALQETFEQVDTALGETLKENEQVYSGTTAVVALYRDNRVWVANAGDSRAVLGTEDREASGRRASGEVEQPGLASFSVPVVLSDDHNPDRPGELERIESCGGFVSPPPEEGLSARVWLNRELTRIGLAMARSIGDHAVKDVGVIATPEIKVRSVTDSDAFLVLASDGVWEFMANQEVVDIVQRSIIRGGGREAAEACAEVIAASAERWRQFEGAYRDDISCIVLRLPCFDGAGGRVARPENMLESVDETGKRMGDKEP